MKSGMTLLAGILLAGTMALAADAENSASTTVDHSKNPITGTETTTTETKGMHKDGSHKDSMKKKSKHKKMKDGSTETTTTTEEKH